MNTKIFNLLVKKIKEQLNLEKHQEAVANLSADTMIDDLPWTPARYRKFKEAIEHTLGLEAELSGTLKDITHDLDVSYSSKFFSQMWQPITDTYSYTGWQLVDEVNKLNPDKVLDVGCGYNQLKPRIQNLIGIDPYNNQSDYQVDILDFVDDFESYDAIIALGSINFNGREDIDAQIKVCVDLLKPGGKMFFRVNPGITHEHGPWVQIFPWAFADVQCFAKKYNLIVETFKKDNNDRLYFVYVKE